MATPPLNRLASIPFEWEEVPGKPRPDLVVDPTTTTTTTDSTASTSSPLHDYKNRPVARCLELPPRLVNSNNNNATVVNALSPTTVLDGPYNYYESPFLCQSQRRSFSSLPRGSFRNILIDKDKEGAVGGVSNRYCENVIGDRENQRFKFSSSSWRWGSFKDTTTATARGGGVHVAGGDDTSPRFSSKIRRDNNSSKFFRVKRRSSSLFNFSRSGSNFLSGVYGSLKQAVSWKR